MSDSFLRLEAASAGRANGPRALGTPRTEDGGSPSHGACVGTGTMVARSATPRFGETCLTIDLNSRRRKAASYSAKASSAAECVSGAGGGGAGVQVFRGREGTAPRAHSAGRKGLAATS